MEKDTAQLEKIIGYEFEDKALLKQSLCHPSYKKQNFHKDNERLEFFGDSILGFIIAEILYLEFKNEKEGELAKRKAGMVCRDALADIAKEIGLGKFMYLGTGEDQSGGRESDANLENCLEAVIAAIYLDGGEEKTKDFINKFFAKRITNMDYPPKDPKSELQEWAQSRGMSLPKYEIVSINGPAHEPDIEIRLELGEHKITTRSGSKKEAQKMAAEELLEIVKG